MLALNCGFGPKDLQDLTWDDIEGERITLPRSKTGVCQTYLLWLETKELLDEIRQQRAMLIVRMAKRKVQHSDYTWPGKDVDMYEDFEDWTFYVPLFIMRTSLSPTPI